jgi:excinuclease ABC subunit B
MYADSITDSMALAIDETNRRRAKQVAYNRERGIDPQPLRKKIGDITDILAREDADTEALLAATGDARRRGVAVPLGGDRNLKDLPSGELASLIEQLTSQMHAAAAELQFEVAARLRDEIGDLKKELRQMLEATA